MRRWLAATVCAALGVMGVTGCTKLPGVDRNLTNGWSAPPAATGFRPSPGTCHESAGESMALEDYDPVDCEESHVVETVYVGTVSGAAAETDERPKPGSAAAKAAYRECRGHVAEFLGAPHRTGRVGLHMVWPSTAAWAGGARWYRCDVGQFDQDDAGVATISEHLGLKLDDANSPLRLRCFAVRSAKGKITAMPPASCDKRHNAEFAGLWTAPASITLAKLGAGEGRAARGCEGVIARFAKLPRDGTVRYRTGLIWSEPSDWEWKHGERSVQCFVYIQKGLNRSVRGAGTRGLPINYA